MKKPRKHYTAEEKVAILRRHLLEQEPVSKLCDELGLQPTVFYRWQKEFFENGAAAFQAKARADHQAEQGRIKFLEKKIQRKDEVLAELTAEHIALKKEFGEVWVPHDVRDQIVDFVRRWSEASEIGVGRFVGWLGVTASKFYDWRERYGRVNEHNGWVPRDFWLEDWEKQAIIAFHLKNPLEGYRRLTFMMLDAEIVAVSPASVWRVLSRAGLLRKWNSKPSKKGTGFSDNGPQFIAKDFKEFHPHLGHDARENFALLSTVERKNRTLAQITKGGMHSAWHAADARGRAAPDSAIRGPLQYRAVAQRDRLRDAGRHAGRKAEGDPRRTGPQTGGGVAGSGNCAVNQYHEKYPTFDVRIQGAYGVEGL